jgi:Kef-type K+ transport system membrane component KefB/mannitol/fructose-specific phosphotransferase system IIA component (Ntr-type)
MAPADTLVMLLGLGVLLAAARLLGEVARRFNQPSVLGEILAGILLGPTLLGQLIPEWTGFLFPSSGPPAVALQGLSTLAIVLFLLVAGMEVDLSTVWRQGKSALSVGAVSLLFPFSLGFAVASFFPSFFGRGPEASPLIFALFFATALSISALPVIAKILMDLNLYRSDLGMLVVATAVVNDLTGWLVFSVILGMSGSGGPRHFAVGVTIGLTLAFVIFMLTAGRWIIHRVLPWVQAHSSWPGGVLGFAVTLALLGAAFAEWIGIHAIFGAFLLGVAVGDSSHLREHTRATLNQFVSFIFAPLFFASIGLRLDFAAHFDGPLTLLVLLIACTGMIVGCRLGAHFARIESREAWALSFAMNARGAMEIVLGLLALEFRLIEERMFVSLVLMAMATSMMSGPLIKRVLRHKMPRRFFQYIRAGGFLRRLSAADRWKAIREMSVPLSKITGIGAEEIVQAVSVREETMPTGLSRGLAVPHARLPGLTAPEICVGLSPAGIDFDAQDGEPCHAIFLILSPMTDDGTTLEVFADIIRTFQAQDLLPTILGAASYSEFLAAVRSGKPLSAQTG